MTLGLRAAAVGNEGGGALGTWGAEIGGIADEELAAFG